MVFWMGILAGALFAWVAVQIGFYQTWAIFFNTVISIYLAVFLTPVITNAVPATGEISCGNTLTLAAVAIAAFLIFQGITYAFVPDTLSAFFPKVLNTVGSGIIGFLAGLLVWSFIALLISAMPAGHSAFAQDIGFGRKIQQSQAPYITWWCNLVHSAAAFGDSKHTSNEIIASLLDYAEGKAAEKRPAPAEPNKPGGPDAKSDSASGQKQRSPPRRANLNDI
jgi:hypothetical protein